MWAPWWAYVATLTAGLAVPAGTRELDPAACAARFDVQRDKIIRTEESREMGARYLSELDVGARQECLRLCCETDACDVFVYEEKVRCDTKAIFSIHRRLHALTYLHSIYYCLSLFEVPYQYLRRSRMPLFFSIN